MHWREPLETGRHRDHFYPGIGGRVRSAPVDGLIPAWSYFVRAAGFTFEFAGVGQISAALEYFQRRTHPSSADPHANPHEKEWQRWFERLPKGLSRETNRLEIVRALAAALAEFGPAPAEAPVGGCTARAFVGFLRDRGVEVEYTRRWITCRLGGRDVAIPNERTLKSSTCRHALGQLGLDPASLDSGAPTIAANAPKYP